MIYYRIKPQYDNKKLCTIKKGAYVGCGDILVANELYTIKEWEKLTKSHVFGFAPSEAYDVVEIPKSKIYWFFGARFASKEV